MIAEPLDLLDGAVQSLAQRYRKQGYEVLVEPQQSDLPPALQRFKPDLIARRGSEGIIAEVKRRRPAAREAWVRTEQMAEAARALPGWRFELVLIDDTVEGPDSGGRDWSLEDARRVLAEAAELIKGDRVEAALLLLFAAAEAHLRSVAAAEGVTVPSHGVTPLISALTSAGVLSRQEYTKLMDGLAARNAVAHGRRPEPMPDRDTLLRLVEIVRQAGQDHATAASTA